MNFKASMMALTLASLLSFSLAKPLNDDKANKLREMRALISDVESQAGRAEEQGTEGFNLTLNLQLLLNCGCSDLDTVLSMMAICV